MLPSGGLPLTRTHIPTPNCASIATVCAAAVRAWACSWACCPSRGCPATDRLHLTARQILSHVQTWEGKTMDQRLGYGAMEKLSRPPRLSHFLNQHVQRTPWSSPRGWTKDSILRTPAFGGVDRARLGGSRRRSRRQRNKAGMTGNGAQGAERRQKARRFTRD